MSDTTIRFKADFSDVRQAMAELNRLLKIERTEFQVATSAMKNWGSSSDGLVAKTKQLNNELKLQKEALARAQKAYDNEAKKTGDDRDEKKLQQYEAAINRLTADIKKNETYLGKYTTELNRLNALYQKSGADAKSFDNNLENLSDDIKKQEDTVKRLALEYSNSVKNTGEFSEQSKRLGAALKDEQNTLKEMQASMKAVSDATKVADSSAKEYDSQVDKLADDIKRQEQVVRELALEYNKASQASGKHSREARELEQTLEKEKGTLSGLRSQMNAVNSATKQTDGSTEKLTASAKRMGDGFTVAKGIITSFISQGLRRAITACKDLAKEAITAGAGFEEQMSRVKAISGASSEDMEKLADKAKEVSASSKFNATEAGQALEYMAMAGWKTNDMLNGLNSVMELAAISGNDLAEVSDIVTDDLTALGYKSTDAEKFADVLAAIATNSNTDVEKIGQTFKNVGTVAGSLGYSIEDLGFALGTMANSAIKSGKAGTDLRSILTRLSNNAGATKNKLGALEVLTKNLGVSFYDTSGKVRPLSKVLAEARKAWKGLSDEQKISYATTIAGQRGMGAWLAMMKASPKDVKKLTQAIKDSDGAADKMSKTMLNNVSGSFTKLKNNLHSGFIDAFEAMKPALNNILKMIIKFIDSIDFTAAGKALGDFATKFMYFIKAVLQNLPSIINYIKIFGTTLLAAFAVGKIVSLISGIVSAIQGLIAAVGAAETAVAAFSVATAALPIVGLIAGITALVGTFGLFSDASEEAKKDLTNLSEAEREHIDQLNEDAKATKETADARKDALGNIKVEYKNIEDLKKRYNRLIGANGKVKKGYEDVADTILNELASALGVSRDEIDKCIKKNGKLGKSLDNLAKKNQALAIQEAYRESYTEARRNKQEKTDELTEVNAKIHKNNDELEKLTGKREELQKKLAELTGPDNGEGNFVGMDVQAVNETSEQLKKVDEQIQTLNNDIDDLSTTSSNLRSELNEYNVTIDNFDVLSKAIESGDPAKIDAAICQLTSDLKTAMNSTQEELDAQIVDLQTHWQNMMTSFFDGTLKPYEAQASAKANIDIIREAYKQAGRELDDGTLSSYFADWAKTMGDVIPDEIANGIESGSTKIEDAEKTLNKYFNFETFYNQAKSSGAVIPNGLVEGIKSGKTPVESAIKKIKKVIKLNDTINTLRTQGVTIPKTITDAITNGDISVKKAMNGIKKAITIKDGETVVKKDAQKIVDNLDSTVQKGIKKTESTAKKSKTGESIAKSADDKGKTKKNVKKAYDGADKEAKAGNKKLKTDAKQGRGSIQNTWNSPNLLFTDAFNIVMGAIKGWNAGFPQLLTKVKADMFKLQQQSIDKPWGVNSPSKWMKGRAGYIIQGFVNGIVQDMPKAVKAMTEMTKASLGAVDKEADMHSPSKKMKKKGENLMKGLALGIISGSSTVTAVMTNRVKSILSGIPDTYKDKSKAQKELAKLRGTGVNKDIKNMSLKTLNKQIDKATSKIKSLRKELKKAWGTDLTDKAKGWDAKKLQKEINKAKKELPKLRKQLAQMYDIEVNAKIKKMGSKEIKAEIKKLDALRKEIESLGIELTPELKKMDSKKLKKWLDDWKSPIKELERDLTRLSGTIIKEKFSDIITQVGEQTKGVINIAKDGVAGVIDELLKLNNFNFSEVANNATSFFSKSLSKKIDYSQRLVNYRIDQREQEYQKNIDAIEQAADAENDRLSNAKDADKRKIGNDKKARLNAAKQERDEYKNNVKAAKEDEIEKIKDKRDKKIQKLEKKKKNTKNSKKKKQYSEQISALKEYYKEVIDQTKKHYDQMIKNADEEYNQKKTNIDHWYDDAIEGNEQYYDGLADQAKNGYDKLKDEQQSYLDSFKGASSEFMNGFNDALKEYEDAANSLINNAVSGVTSKYETLYNNLLQKQDTLTNKLRGWSDFFSVSNAKVLRVDDISKATEEIRAFYDKLERLKGSVPEEVIDKIISSGKEEGSAYADYLLNMSDAELKQYAGQMQDYLDWADWMGQDLYHKDRDKVASDYQKAIKEAFAGIEDELAELGRNIFKGFCDGFADNIDYMDSTITTIVSQMIQQFKDELGIHSPSRVMMQIGDYTGQGFVDGLAESLGGANAEVSKMVAQIVRTVGGVSDNIGQVRIGNALSSIDGAKFGSTTNNRNVSNTENITNNYNLVQNNHSPKALTGLDTYLARRQQIAQLKLMGV